MGRPNIAVTKVSALCGKFCDVGLPTLLHPMWIGALLLMSLSTWVLSSTLRNDRYEGADAAGVRQFLTGEYHSEMLLALGLVAALSALLGLALGMAVGWSIRLRQAWLGREALSRLALAWRSCVGIGFVYITVWFDDVTNRPALYQDLLYARGGLRAAFQTWATEHCGRAGVWLGFSALVVAWLLLPLPTTGGATRRLRQLGLVVVAAVACVLLALVPWRRAGRSQHQANAERPNVIIIAADSLRPDRMTPAVAPAMVALAQQGVVFDRAYSPLPRTFPAWVSILTGNYPHHHGIRNMFPRWETRLRDFHAIPGAFARAGYFTGVVSDFAGDIFRRVDLGFQRVTTPTLTMRELLRERILQQNWALLPWLRGPVAHWAVPALREMHVASDAPAVTKEALHAIDEAAERPFFITVFYSTTHFPYAAPSPYYKEFVKPEYRGPFRYAKADTLVAETAISQDDVNQVRGLFDGAVAAVDAAVADLMDGLTARGLLGRTIVAVTADHGESLYENGRGQGHGDHLYGEESLRVPLVLLGPGIAHAKLAMPISSIDLAPTLCELANVDCRKDVNGRSLAGAISGKQLPNRPVFAETGLWFTETVPEVPIYRRIAYPDLIHLTEVDRAHSDEIVMRRQWESLTIAAKYRMIRDERYKLIYMPTRSGPRFELFDTVEDPAEVRDISKSAADVMGYLKPQLLDWILKDVSVERRGDLVVPRVQTDTAGAEP